MMPANIVARMARVAGEGVDRLFVRFAFKTRRASTRTAGSTSLSRLAEATTLYPAADAAGRLFATPAAAPLYDERWRRVRHLRQGEVVDVAWASLYEPIHDAYRETMGKVPENLTAHARWFRHHAPSPALVCLHGWGAGRFAFEERAFAADWFYGLGLDVVLFTLPFHARRAPPRRRVPMFPSPDPIRSNEGFAQTIHDLRALVLALRARGANAVAVSGMSLGGFTTSLLATVAPPSEVDAAIPVIPFASLPEILWEHGDGTEARRRAQEAGVDFDRFAAAFAATTPVLRRPTLGADRILLVAGEHDRVTPKKYAERLRDHFSAGAAAPVTLVTYPGAHLLQSGRGEALRAMARFLGERGLIATRSRGG